MAANLTSITSAEAAQALALYLAHAYPDNQKPYHHPPAINAAAPVDRTLALFIDETQRGASQGCPRYVLRLGNHAYPHMKLAIEQAMDGSCYFFAVDTHDQAGVSAAAIGKEQWQALQDKNAAIKAIIEKAWYDAGLPTLKRMRELTAKATVALKPKGSYILVVDDEEDAAQLYSIVLAREGYRVRSSSGGEECLQIARETKPDLVLLDYMMPELSGREVCERLKGDSATAAIPVLIATYADVDGESLRLADGVMKKPVITAELVKRVQSLVRPAGA